MRTHETTVVVLVSANVEWQAILQLFPGTSVTESPLGEWFVAAVKGKHGLREVLFYHGGWGKIAAAASAQYVIERFSPSLLVNLGTCGGIRGEVERGTVVLVERTIVYDIYEQMYDAQEHIEHYTTEINLDWLNRPYPHDVLRTHIVSADRDLFAHEIPSLKNKYGAVVGDWESGSIAWVANRNDVRCLILRGVSDLVGLDGGEAFNGNVDVFEKNTLVIMQQLVSQLPDWIALAE